MWDWDRNDVRLPPTCRNVLFSLAERDKGGGKRRGEKSAGGKGEPMELRKERCQSDSEFIEVGRDDQQLREEVTASRSNGRAVFSQLPLSSSMLGTELTSQCVVRMQTQSLQSISSPHRRHTRRDTRLTSWSEE